MQKIFNLTNTYIVIATPLIIYSLVSSIYLAISMSGGRIVNLLIAIILFTLMTAAFMSGWFNMIKLAVSEQEKEEPNMLIKYFTPGVGEYFLSALGSLVVMLLVSALLLFISFAIGSNCIGDPGVSAETLSKALQNSSELKAFVSSLSTEQLVKINSWNMLILGTMILTYFLFFLYMPVLFFKNKNPFWAFFISLKDIFSKNIFKTIGIFFLILVVNIFVSVLSSFFGNNAVLHFIITLLNFYFVTIVGVGLFYYYYHTFVKSLLGQNVDIQV